MSQRELELKLRELNMRRTDPALADVKAVLHELEVHQIELEMQNRELTEAQHQIELSRDRYVELYDSSPVGYLTLDAKGRIVDLNLCAARLLSQERDYV